MPHFQCLECSNVATEQQWVTPTRAACPICGSKHFAIKFEWSLKILPYGAVRARQRDPYHKSERKLRREEFRGPQANKTDKLMDKQRIIDKDNDYYYEKVTDPETGEVVRLCEEKLSEHVERGSAKKKPKKNDA